MTFTMRPTHAIAVGVADVRLEPDPSSEQVTQALMNFPAVANQTNGEWTHITLSDYEGWIRTGQLAEPIAHFLPANGLAVIVATHTPLYTDSEGDDTQGMVYLSTALPLLDTLRSARVQVALPGGRVAWITRNAIDIRQSDAIYPRQPVRVVTTFARSLLGRPYLWGGTSWEGLDCSGFVQLCYRMGGSIIPRDADQQHDALTHDVKREEMQEGDLIFFGSARITHVGMALDARQYIHAEGQNYNRVVINSFDPADAHYYPRLDEIVWAIKRVDALEP
jgi:hypothetical protein